MDIQTNAVSGQEIRQLWTRKQTQEFLNVGRSLFYELLRNGVVPPPVKLGTANRWIPDEVEKAIANQKITPVAADRNEGN